MTKTTNQVKTKKPTPEDFARAAEYLGCDVAAIKAVAQVEAGSQGAFLVNGLPVILFEAHVFDRLTESRFRGAKASFLPQNHPAAVLSREKWLPGTYGSFSIQHTRLNAAALLNRPAAIKATSWGLFQILGENYKRCGFDGPEDFVEAMYRDVDAHLLAFTHFIESDENLRRALIAHNWPTFARIYNGPGYKRNHYDSKLAAAYESETRRLK